MVKSKRTQTTDESLVYNTAYCIFLSFQLRVTVWSLVTKSVSYIRYPKQCQKGE